MKNIDAKEIDLSTLSFEELYKLKAKARLNKDGDLLARIRYYLNGRSGSFGSQIDYSLYTSIDANCKFIEAGKLIKGGEKILVLVQHGTPEQLNANTVQFWRLQDLITQVAYQEDPNNSDLQKPTFKLMDPTVAEELKKDGLVQAEMEKADIVLKWNGLNTWMVLKSVNEHIDYKYRYRLKFPEVTLDNLLVNKPKDIWVYIDHRLMVTTECENLYHAFSVNMVKRRQSDINIHLMSGHPSQEWLADKEIVLCATPTGFFVDCAKDTPYKGSFIIAEELKGWAAHSTLTSECRTHHDAVWSPVDPNTLLNRE